MTTISQPAVHNEDSIRRLVLLIVDSVVDDEKSVRLDYLEEEGLTTLNIHLGSSDIGKLIGKQGRTAFPSYHPFGSKHEAPTQLCLEYRRRMRTARVDVDEAGT